MLAALLTPSRTVRTLAALLTVSLAVSFCAIAHGQTGESPRPGRRGLFHLYGTPAAGEPPLEWFDRWREQPYALGDWFGLRPALERVGIVPTVNFVSDVQGNPLGGERQALREFDDLFVGLNVELEKLVGAPGTKFHVGFSQRSGTSLSDIDIGNTFNVAEVCCGATYRLVDVYLEQPLLGDRLNVRVGRMASGDEFMSSPLYWMFVQSGFDGNPFGIFLNAPGMSAYPIATWGLRVRVEPVEWFYAMAGVFNGDPTLIDNDKHGVDWSMRGPVFAIAEIGLRLNQGPADAGLPGNYKLGAYYNGGTYPDFLRDTAGGLAPVTGLPPRTTRGKTGFYVLADQMVYREAPGPSPQGLTPFVAVVVAPDQSTNAMPLFVNGGLVYTGLFPRRDRDVAAFGVVYGRFSQDQRRAQQLERQTGVAAQVQTYEIALEWTYALQVARWLSIQPDVQYIIRPGGGGHIPNALVLGTQFAVTF